MAFTFDAGIAGRKRDEDEERPQGAVRDDTRVYNDNGRKVGDLPTVTPRNDEDDQPMVYDPGVNKPASEEKDQYADLHPEQYEYSWTEEQRKYYDDLSRQNNEALGLTETKAETPKKQEEKPLVYVPQNTNAGTSGAGTNAAGTKAALTGMPEGAESWTPEQWREYMNQPGNREAMAEVTRQGTDRTAAANRQERRERGGADRAERNAPQGTFQPRTNQGSTAAPANDQPVYTWQGIRAGDFSALADLMSGGAPRIPDTGGQSTPAPAPQREPDAAAGSIAAANANREAVDAYAAQEAARRERADQLQAQEDYLAAWQRRQDEIDRRNLADSSIAAANAAREEQAAQERALEGSLAAAEANRYEMEQGAAQDRERRDQMAQLRAAKEEWDRQQREAQLLATRDQDVARMSQDIAAQMGYVPPETGSGTNGTDNSVKRNVEPKRAGQEPEVHSSGGGSSRGEVHYSYKGKPQTGGNSNRPGVNAEVNSWDQGTGTSAGTGTKGQEDGNGNGTKTVSGTGTGSSDNGKGSDVPKGSTYFTPSYGQDMEKGVKAPYRKEGYTAEEIEKMGNKARSDQKYYNGKKAYEGYYLAPNGKYYPVDQIKANYYRENGSYAGWNEGMRDYWNTFGTFYGYRPGWKVDGRLGSGGGGGGGYSGGGRSSGGGYSYGGGSSSSGRGGGATANNGLYWNGNTSWNI